MTITLLNLYNEIASQPWSMFDNDAKSVDDFDESLLSAINKSLVEIWCSYPFEFRLATKILFIQPCVHKYSLPIGTIKQKETVKGIQYKVKLNNRYLEFIEDYRDLQPKTGRPTGFFVEDDKICFYPMPDKVYRVSVDYYSLAVGYDSYDNPVYRLQKGDDYINIPEQYEQLFINALISKVMMYALVDISDDNYTGYNIQYEKAYKALIRSMGIRKKVRKIGW